MQNKVWPLTRDLLSKHEESSASASKTNPKKFWKYASIQKSSRYLVTELSVNWITIADHGDISEDLKKQFKSVSTLPKDTPSIAFTTSSIDAFKLPLTRVGSLND
jgi:hypothetical protein